jgi:hypothetical protein
MLHLYTFTNIFSLHTAPIFTFYASSIHTLFNDAYQWCTISKIYICYNKYIGWSFLSLESYITYIQNTYIGTYLERKKGKKDDFFRFKWQTKIVIKNNNFVEQNYTNVNEWMINDYQLLLYHHSILLNDDGYVSIVCLSMHRICSDIFFLEFYKIWFDLTILLHTPAVLSPTLHPHHTFQPKYIHTYIMIFVVLVSFLHYLHIYLSIHLSSSLNDDDADDYELCCTTLSIYT